MKNQIHVADMPIINKDDLIIGYHYLVSTSYNWSPSGFDIAEWDGEKFISQSSGDDRINDFVVKHIQLKY